MFSDWIYLTISLVLTYSDLHHPGSNEYREWEHPLRETTRASAGGPRAELTLSNVVTLITAMESEKCSSSSDFTRQLVLAQKRVISILLHTQLWSEHFPTENIWLSSVTARRLLFGHSYLAPFDGDLYLENTLGCILRKRTTYSFDNGYHYVEFWREILFNLYVFRRFTTLSPSLYNNNGNVVLITITKTTTTSTNEKRVSTPQVI